MNEAEAKATLDGIRVSSTTSEATWKIRPADDGLLLAAVAGDAEDSHESPAAVLHDRRTGQIYCPDADGDRLTAALDALTTPDAELDASRTDRAQLATKTVLYYVGLTLLLIGIGVWITSAAGGIA